MYVYNCNFEINKKFIYVLFFPKTCLHTLYYYITILLYSANCKHLLLKRTNIYNIILQIPSPCIVTFKLLNFERKLFNYKIEPILVSKIFVSEIGPDYNSYKIHLNILPI